MTTPPDSAWKGIFAIPVTPFDDELDVHRDDLVRQVEFCLEAGVDGIVYPGVVSEFFTLSETERTEAVALVAKTIAGRVPLIAGVSATSQPIAAELARHAASVGAAGVMAMLPYVNHFFSPSAAEISGYFAAIAAAGKLPIVLQNARIGHTIGFGAMPKLFQSVPSIRYLKQETAPSTHEVGHAIDSLGGFLDGVFAGLGGVYLLNELDRGAVGSMPAPPVVDRICEAYRLATSGRRTDAEAVLEPLAGYFALELLYNLGVIKEVLRRRGVISSVACRAPAPRMDAVDLRSLEPLLAALG